MPLTSGLDTRTCAQLCSDLQACTLVECEAYIRAIEERYNMPRGRLTIALGGYGSEAQVSALGPSTRHEWCELLRSGKAFGASINAAAVAAKNSALQLTAATGTLRTLVFGLGGSPGAASDLVVTLNNAAVLGGGAAVNAVNLRRDGVPAAATAFVLGNNANVLAGDQVARRGCLANTAVELSETGAFFAELIAGQTLEIWAVTVNVALSAYIYWAEVARDYPA